LPNGETNERPDRAATIFSGSVEPAFLIAAAAAIRAVADDRAEARVVFEARLVGLEELGVLGCRDRVPRVAGDIPANGRLVLQRVEIFRLAA